MRIVQQTSFKKDIKKLKKRGKDLNKLKSVIDILVEQTPLPARYRDHALAGNWIGWRDCHIEPDWLLVYKLKQDTIILGRTGSHSDLF